MAKNLTTVELGSVVGGTSFELPYPARDLNLMARRGFPDTAAGHLQYQRFRLIMQGIAGYPPIKEW